MNRLAIGVGLAVFSFAVCAQDPLPDWVLRMSRVKRHLKANFEHIPNYVCRESVDRYRKRPAGRMLKIDTLEFEVIEMDRKELLTRPGAGFEDKPISSFISSGILGRGDFAAIPRNLFVADGARVNPHPGSDSAPDTHREGWDFEFSALQGILEIASPGVRVRVGERGTFWVDPDSMDLLRIDQQAVDVPPQTGMTAVGTSVEYARMQIGLSAVLLPRAAATTVVDLDGTEQRNEIAFSGCREYTSESTVHFGDTVEPPAKKK